MPQKEDYPLLTQVADDDYLFVTDTSDTTDKADGSTKVATRAALFGGPRVPSASELSGSTNLADYIEDSLAAYGYCQLPPGEIEYSSTLVFDKLQGGGVFGAGMNPVASHEEISPGVPNGYNNPASTDRYATILRYSGTGQAIDWKNTLAFTIADLGIESDVTAIRYWNVSGFASNFGRISRVAFHPYTDATSGTLAIQAGVDVTDTNGADLEVHSCVFDGVDGLRVKHAQGVNYVLTGTNWFFGSEKAIYFERGGCLCADFLSGMGVETWLTVDAGGPNVKTHKIGYIYSDRTAASPPPVVVDLTGATDRVGVIVEAVKITEQTGDLSNYPGRYAYLLPANHASAGVSVAVNNVSQHNYPPGTSATPTVADNPFDA